MKSKFLWLISLALPIVLFSCSPVYVPNRVNTPVFSEKGELKAGVGFGTSGIDPQIAYSITDNWAIMANGSFSNRNNTRDSADFHTHQFGEFGVGYYEKISRIARFETFFGGGYGNLSGYFDENFNSTYDFWGDNYYNYNLQHANMMRFFLQPSIGITNKIFDGSIATRFVHLTLQNDNNTATSFFIEPVFTAKVGYKYIKWFWQVGLSIPISGYGSEYNIDYQPFICSFGIQANLDIIKKKQE